MAANETGETGKRFIWRRVVLTPLGATEQRLRDIERIKCEIRSLKQQLRELKSRPLPELADRLMEVGPDDPAYDTAAFEIGLSKPENW